ncbi:MAG: glycine cleavage system protein H [Candidatus Woesearchaeota archaeon]
MDYPDGLRYDEKYSWVRKEGDAYEVGITKASAEEGDEFVFIQLPEVGKKLSKGGTYVSVESSKSSGHIPSPLSGTVVEVNEALFDDPSLINHDPYGSWIMRIEAEASDYESLLRADERRG